VKRIVIVEDNPDLAFGLRNNLELEGYEVAVRDDGQSGLERILVDEPDLVLLDLMLPGMDGIAVLKEMRARGAQCPVLVLTARGDESDKVMALRLGADDYVTKPFGLMELVARVEALLRRESSRSESVVSDVVRFGRIEARLATREVFKEGRPVGLTPKEFDLLVALLRRNGAVVSRADLLDEVWGYAADVQSRTVDTHIAELRKKLEDDPASPDHLLTVRKAGYRLEHGPADSA
jgi:DNA-binding response OmpR family regulator